MKKIIIITLFLAISSFAHNNNKPNVLFISIDDLNDWIGVMGIHPGVKTPNIDKLAATGMLFSNAHCQFPVCGPSRTSVFSGYRPTTTNVLNNDAKTKDSNVKKMSARLGNRLMHQYIGDHGYKTMAVGKLMHTHIAKGSVNKSGGRFKTRNLQGRLNFKSENTGTDWGVFPGEDAEMADYKQTDWAIARLEEKHDKPFLLMLGLQLPHVPWIVSQKWWDLYNPEKITLAPFLKNDHDDLPTHSIETNILSFMPQTEKLRKIGKLTQATHSYLASISFIDHQVGRVLESLKSSSYKDNTIVILWSDHGYHLGEKGTFQKHSLWQRASHVPLIISTPGMTKPGICKQPVELLDLYPTLVDLCGLPANSKNEGLSLKPFLKNPQATWNKVAITTYRKQKKHSQATGVPFHEKPSHGIYDERFHYIIYSDGSEELYDLKKDPNEWRNIASKPEMHSIKKRLKKSFDNQIKPRR